MAIPAMLAGDVQRISARGDEDPSSATVQVASYLRGRGLPMNSANVRAALEANARDPALMPRLVGAPDPLGSDDPSVGQGGNVAGRIESAPTRTSAQPTSQVAPAIDLPQQGPTDQAASSGLTDNLGAIIAGGGAAGLGAYLAGRARYPQLTPTPYTEGIPMPGPGPMPQLTSPAEVQTGNRFLTGPSQPDPMGSAMNRAVPSETPPVIQLPDQSVPTGGAAGLTNPPPVQPPPTNQPLEFDPSTGQVMPRAPTPAPTDVPTNMRLPPERLPQPVARPGFPRAGAGRIAPFRGIGRL